jgi:DNA-binding MarR family transcriptional regulator
MKTRKINEFRQTLRKLERELDAQLREDLTCCGVSLVQCHTVLELERQGKTNLKELSSSLDLDKSTVSRTIDQLVNEGLVSREIDANNRRFVLLSLSEKGKDACRNINKFCNDYYRELFEHIPEEKHAQVVESFSLFAESLAAVKKGRTAVCGDITCFRAEKSEKKK